MRLELGRYATHVDVALELTRHWTLNKLQPLAVLIPAAFLDDRGTRLQEEGGRQHFQYVGGEGGTGKSRVIHAIHDMFRLKDGLHISVFAAKHDTESGKRLSTQELCHVLRHGDDSQLPTPGLFFYAQGIPVVVTRNQFVGLKVGHGAPFKAVDIFPDLACGTIALANDVTFHLGPPVAVLLQSDDSAGLAIPRLPNGAILVKSKMVAIPSQMRGKEGGWRGKPGFRWVTHRTGPLCTPAFAMTDQKSQGKQFSDVLVNLKGVRGGGTATRPSFMSLYVQLSRAQSWDGLHLFRKPARSDFIEPKNVLDKDMRDAILKLERQGEETRRRFEEDHRHEPWFQEWDAMPESAQAAEAADEDAGTSL